MTKNIKFLYENKISFIFFVIFSGFNIYYFTNNFFSYFFNENGNADEYYENTLYFISDFSLNKIFYTTSQPYIFISSVVNIFLDCPKMATRLVSLICCLSLLFYFIKRIYSDNVTFIENTYKISLFICAIFITNQMYIGTSDFLSFVFIVPPFLIIIENFRFGRFNLKVKQSIIIGMFFALSVATRPTSIVLLVSLYATFFLMGYIRAIFCKENYIILISSFIVFFMINFLPIIQQNRIILDVKDIPKETGVTWFQRNYLMAKYWDSNKIPLTKWISTQEVIDFKKENPKYVFPKNQIDLLIKEPGLYFRQMVRMFIKAFYTSYRFMYVLFLFSFLSFIKFRKFEMITNINEKFKNEIFKNKFIVLFHIICILLFSFLAVKLFEFRWVIPILILYVYFSIKYLSEFPKKMRFLVYNVSFISGIVMYIFHYMKAH